MPQGMAAPYPLVNAQVINGTGTYNSIWQDISGGVAFAIFYKASSVLGSVKVTIYLDVSPYSASTLAKASTDASLYVSETVVTDYATESTLVRYDPTILGTPAMSARIRVAGVSGNQTDTIVNVILVRYGL